MGGSFGSGGYRFDGDAMDDFEDDFAGTDYASGGRDYDEYDDVKGGSRGDYYGAQYDDAYDAYDAYDDDFDDDYDDPPRARSARNAYDGSSCGFLRQKSDHLRFAVVCEVEGERS